MRLSEILINNVFHKVELTLTSGVQLTGYIVDVKLPVVTGLAIHFVEEHKAKRYLAKYNSRWLDSILIDMVVKINNLDFDTFSIAFRERREGFYTNSKTV